MELGFGSLVFLGIIVAIVFGLSYISGIIYRIESILRMLGGTGLAEALEGDALRRKREPLSISGMTRLELPRVEKDFPEFHWPEWKQRCENIMKGYLEAVEHRSVAYINEAGPGLKEQVQLTIEDNIERDIQEQYSATKIHATEIARYEREKFVCRLAVQMSVEFLHSAKGNGIEKPLENEQEQHRYELELVYVQDVTALGKYDMGFGVNCPNCGAPITNLGSKFCTYCGTAVEPVNIRVWLPNKLKEI